jgi:hypothetical protein
VRRLSDFTHIGRVFDLRCVSNRFALLAPMVAGVVVFAFDTSDLRRAVIAALVTFAAWATARELDPDRPRSAELAAVFAPLVTVVLGAPAAAPLFVAMLSVRIVVRSTGLPPKTTDLAVLTLGSILVADTPWGWAAGIVLAFAMVRDAALPGEPPLNAGLWGSALAIGVTIRVALADGLGIWTVPDTAAFLTMAVGLAGAVIVLQPVPVLSLGDWTKEPLDPRRLREGALFGIMTAVVAVAASGAFGVVAVAPLFLTFTAVALVRLLARTRPA